MTVLMLNYDAMHTDYDGMTGVMRITGMKGIGKFPGDYAVTFGGYGTAPMMRLVTTEGPMVMIDSAMAKPRGMVPVVA